MLSYTERGTGKLRRIFVFMLQNTLPQDCYVQSERMLHGRSCLHICFGCNNSCDTNFTHHHLYVGGRSQLTLIKRKKNTTDANGQICNCSPYVTFWQGLFTKAATPQRPLAWFLRRADCPHSVMFVLNAYGEIYGLTLKRNKNDDVKNNICLGFV